jgi:hypothetical protein
MLPIHVYACPICGDATVARDTDQPTCCLPMALVSFTCSTCQGEGCQHCNYTGMIQCDTKAEPARPLGPLYGSIADEVDLDDICRGDRVAAQQAMTRVSRQMGSSTLPRRWA